jgi:hypothetical protein
MTGRRNVIPVGDLSFGRLEQIASDLRARHEQVALARVYLDRLVAAESGRSPNPYRTAAIAKVIAIIECHDRLVQIPEGYE